MESTPHLHSGAPVDFSTRQDVNMMFSSNSYEDDDGSLSPSAAGGSSEAGAHDREMNDHFRSHNIFQSTTDFHHHHMSTSSSSTQVMDPNAMHIVDTHDSHFLGHHDGGDVAYSLGAEQSYDIFNPSLDMGYVGGLHDMNSFEMRSDTGAEDDEADSAGPRAKRHCSNAAKTFSSHKSTGSESLFASHNPAGSGDDNFAGFRGLATTNAEIKIEPGFLQHSPAVLAALNPAPSFPESSFAVRPKRLASARRKSAEEDDEMDYEDEDVEGESGEEGEPGTPDGDAPYGGIDDLPPHDPLVPLKGNYIHVMAGPGRHQVKDFNILPINILKVAYEARDEDYILIRLVCDQRMKLRDRKIFVTAVSAKHNVDNDNEIVLQNLKISKDMLQGRTKGFQFFLTYTLMAGGREAETIKSHPFYIWSNVKQLGFPRQERDKYLEQRKQINRGKRKR